MKKIFWFVVCVWMSMPLMAQQEEDPTPNPKAITRDRITIEFVHSNWIWDTQPTTVETKWHSRGINFLYTYDIPIANSKNISVAPGLGITNSNVFSNVRLGYDTLDNVVSTTMTAFAENLTVNKNKISTTHLVIPLELRLRTNPNKSNKTWKLGLGVRVGYLLEAKHKYKGSDIIDNTSREIFIKQKDLYNFNRLKYAGTVRIGYGSFNLIGEYSLATLLQKNKGPKIYPISVGITFNSL
ncbi:MAG: outer membrane beta-barrel protein [Chitinophagales bacterium]